MAKEKYNLAVINAGLFDMKPGRYEIRSGLEEAAPNCPYGGRFMWLGYDNVDEKYVRLTKSVFKKMIVKLDKQFVLENERKHAELHD